MLGKTKFEIKVLATSGPGAARGAQVVHGTPPKQGRWCFLAVGRRGDQQHQSWRSRDDFDAFYGRVFQNRNAPVWFILVK